jgi:hypothetical protein
MRTYHRIEPRTRITVSIRCTAADRTLGDYVPGINGSHEIQNLLYLPHPQGRNRGIHWTYVISFQLFDEPAHVLYYITLCLLK